MWTGGVGVQIEGTVDRIERYRNSSSRDERGENGCPWRLLIGACAHGAHLDEGLGDKSGRSIVRALGCGISNEKKRSKTNKNTNQRHMGVVTAGL